jgi:hypothetical protein
MLRATPSLTWRFPSVLSLAHSFTLTGATRPSLPVGERSKINEALARAKEILRS